MRGAAVRHAVPACSSISYFKVAVQVPGRLPMEDDWSEFDYDLQLSWFQEWESTPMPPMHRLGGVPAAGGCSQASQWEQGSRLTRLQPAAASMTALRTGMWGQCMPAPSALFLLPEVRCAGGLCSGLPHSGWVGICQLELLSGVRQPSAQ